MVYLSKFKGLGVSLPPMQPFKQVVFNGLGGLSAATILAYLAYISHQPLILGSFGASIFILFVLPDSPFAQPRNVIGGHFISTLSGLVFLHFIGPAWWSMALALAVALMLMQILRIPHPPAGSNPFIVFLSNSSWSFLFIPTLVGAILLVIVSLFFNNLASERSYPKYW